MAEFERLPPVTQTQRRTRPARRIALATGATVATLLGTQALAIWDRTHAEPVTIGQSAASLNLASDASSAPAKKPAPSLNMNDGVVQPARNQPAPFTLSSRR